MNIPELDELYALYRADLYRYLCRLTLSLIHISEPTRPY